MTGTWPATLYDYARGVIVDEAVADVDLHTGTWVGCRCCDIERRTGVSFDTSAWEHHKKTATHLTRMKAANARSESVRETPEYADFAAAMMESIEKDTDYLVFYRKQLEQRAKEEVQTKTLIQKMALLVTEQQEDIEKLRDEVGDLRDLVLDMRREMKVRAVENAALRRADGSQKKQTTQAPPRFIEIDDSDVQMTPDKRPASLIARKTTRREIDMFDEDLQLMHLD